MNVFHTLDIVLAFVVFFTLLILSLVRVLPLAVSILLGVGFGLGLIWEGTHALVPGFITVPGITGNLKNTTLYVLAHSMWDSLILLGASYLALALGLKWTSACTFFLILVVGFGLEIVVELACQSRCWIYHERRGNPTIFKIGQVPYTLWSLLEWIIVPIPYFFVLRALA